MSDVEIPSDWDGTTYACYSVMWPKSFEWRAILNGLIDTAGTGWYYNKATGSVIAARDAIRATWEYNFKNEEVIMTCSEDSIAELAGIRAALEALVAKECCPTGSAGAGIFNSGSRGAGITPAIIDPYEENPVTEEPPAGFSDWAAYRVHKCNASADTVQHFKVDLLSLSNLSLGENTFTKIITVLVGTLLTPVPYDDLAVLVSLLTIAAVEYSFLAELSSEVQDDEDNLRCVLYNSSDATDAMDNFQDAIAGIIAGMDIIEAGKTWLINVTDTLTPNDVFNQIFEAHPTEAQSADCSECSEGTFDITYGTLTDGALDGAFFTVESVEGPTVGGTARYWIAIGWLGAACIQADIVSDGWSIGDLESWLIGCLVYLCEDGGTYEFFYTDPDTYSGQCFFPASSGGFQYNSRTPFSITVTRGAYPCT